MHILLNNAVHVHAVDLADNSYNTTGAMPSVVAMNKHRVVSFIKNNSQDSLHCVKWYAFLGAFHVDDNVLNAIILYEFAILLWTLLISKRAVMTLALYEWIVL